MISVPDDYVGIDSVEILFSRLKEEYKVKAIKHQRALETLNFGENVLHEETRSLLESCAKCYQILGLNEINHGTLIIKYSDLVLEKAHGRDLALKLKRNEQKFKDVLTEMRKQNFILKREVENATNICQESQDSARKRSGKISFFNEKIKEYEIKLKELQEPIAPFVSGITLSTVIEDAARLKKIEEEIEFLKSKITRYRKLPPDMKLANEKLKHAKLELESSQAELDKAIETLAKTL